MKLSYLSKRSELAVLKYQDLAPFLMRIDGEELLVQQVLRLLPGKRLVVKGLWQQQQVVVKVFYGKRRAHRHLQRELVGYNLLREAQFLVPQLLFAGSLEAEPVYVMVFTELYPIKKLGKLLASDDCQVVKTNLLAVQELIARLHQVGLVHTDLHVDNFLLVNDDYYLLDFTSISVAENKDAQLSNLALFYAQLPIRFRTQLPVLFVDYCKVRGWQESVKLETQLLTAVAEKRFARGKHWREKCLRCCTEVVAISFWRKAYGFLRRHHSNEVMAFIHSPETYLQTNESEVIKAGNTCTVFRVRMGEKVYVVKRYNIKGKWHFLRRCLRTTRALRSWLNANTLALFEVPTAAPVAFVEKHWGGLRLTSYFVMEDLSGEPLGNYFLTTDIDLDLVDATARLLSDLARLSISHGDMKQTNFLVREGEVFLIDLDAMQYHEDRSAWRKAFKRDIKRFRRNWRRNPELLKCFDQAIRREVKF